jgi:hypothetical protein
MGNNGCSIASVANAHIEILPAFPDLPGALGRDAQRAVGRERARSLAFLRLFPHLVDAERFEDGFRWVFLAAPGLERELRALARSEHAYSPFLTFVISVQGDRLVWKACGRKGTEHALDALYGMIAEPAGARSEVLARATTQAS